MDVNMLIKALDMAYENRTPGPDASDIFKQQLKKYQMAQSMSCQCNGLDNAPAESSFFHTLKVDKVYG